MCISLDKWGPMSQVYGEEKHQAEMLNAMLLGLLDWSWKLRLNRYLAILLFRLIDKQYPGITSEEGSSFERRFLELEH